jgi:hypothetical protein
MLSIAPDSAGVTRAWFGIDSGVINFDKTHVMALKGE